MAWTVTPICGKVKKVSAILSLPLPFSLFSHQLSHLIIKVMENLLKFLTKWSKVKVNVTQSCPTLCDPMDYNSPWNSPGQNTGVSSLSILQGIFPTQGLNPGLPHCRQILYQLSHNRSPRILEWVACPFSSGSSRPRNLTGISCTAGRFFTNWAIRKPKTYCQQPWVR